jgi:hypothetical protein
MRADVSVFLGGERRWVISIVGFRNLEVDWVVEGVLKVVTWPGRITRMTELIDVTSGGVLFRAVASFDPGLEPPVTR